MICGGNTKEETRWDQQANHNAQDPKIVAKLSGTWCVGSAEATVIGYWFVGIDWLMVAEILMGGLMIEVGGVNWVDGGWV